MRKYLILLVFLSCPGWGWAQRSLPAEGDYSVVRGDTLYGIAFRHGLDYRELAALNGIAGRHHYNLAYVSLFAGGGVKGGRIIGKTDAKGEHVIDAGWRYKKQQIKTENVYASIYSALGIDWTKAITNTPSKRAYRYVDPLGATEMLIDDEITDLFV